MTIENVLTAAEELLDASTFSGRSVARKNLRRELTLLVTEEREACIAIAFRHSKVHEQASQKADNDLDRCMAINMSLAADAVGQAIMERSNGEVRGASRLSGEASSAEGATSTVVLEGGR